MKGRAVSGGEGEVWGGVANVQGCGVVAGHGVMVGLRRGGCKGRRREGRWCEGA